MTRYVAGRVLQAVVVLWAVYTLTFGILYLLPSDPVELQLAAANVQVNELTPAELAAAKQQYGLDQPLGHQYLDHLGGLLRGDFGRSISLHRPVGELLAERLPSTLALGAAAITLALVLGGGLAYLAAFVRVSWLKTLLNRLPAVGVSLPPFFVGLLLIQVFAFELGWFPATGTTGAGSLVLPAVTMALPTAALLAQVLTRSLDDQLAEPYVTTAAARGLSRQYVQARHALRNALLPTLTLLGLLLGATVTEAVVAETVFSRQGVGQMAQQAVLAQDVPLVQAIVVLAAAVFVVINLLIDLVYPLFDPRITHTPRIS
ncbi:ABC transporter permease [Kineosporia rhizophila]|uniref:ABC transporter permease n=1 Tax=Kineosporia TaxID=49184 RepID=UPI001E4CFD71|nr:ABC transporter permease [Kineosporia sp. NBRC 101677]MCE0535589.1 ABC transporter permease [Kineosporia rhizophila]GLY17768.1 peptide ABC transporter permease [Kineosporia sp. NBRC 101677]